MLLIQNSTIKTNLMRGHVPYWFLFEKENFIKKFSRDMIGTIRQSGICDDFSYGRFSYGREKYYIEYLKLIGKNKCF